MLEIKDIEKFAKLARIDLSDAEKQKFLKDIEPVLDYIKQIQEVSGNTVEKKAGEHRNIMREDRIQNETGSNTKELVENMPGSKDNFLTVKKIL
jgi:aspartyl-tRNA(Asn)/glutamyl-tRNA(Gln) amidotransferase subunit C